MHVRASLDHTRHTHFTTAAVPISSLPYGPRTPIVREFLRRLAAQPPLVWLAAERRYARLAPSDDGHRADRALGAAIARLGRDDARDALVGPIVQLAQRAALAPAEDAAGGDADAVERLAEVALAAALALLVSDALAPEQLATLYAPFERAIPFATLAEPAAG